MGENGKTSKKTLINNDAGLIRVYRAIRMLKQPERQIIELFFGNHHRPAESIKKIAQTMNMDVKEAWEIKESGIKNLISICRKLRKHE